MTLCIALETEQGVWLACDSFLGNTYVSDRIDRAKWFRTSDLVIAWAGDVRAAQVMEHAITYRKRGKRESAEHYLVSIASAIRETHRGLVADDRPVDSACIIVHGGLVYEMQRGYSIVRSRRGFTAIGAGSSEALAVMHATKDLEGRERVRRAVQATAKVSQYVRGPFRFTLVR